MDDQTPAADLLSNTEVPGEPSQTGRWAGWRLMDALNGGDGSKPCPLPGRLSQSAAELFTVMERRYGREQSRLRYEKRHADPLIELGRRELQARMAAHRRGVRGSGL